MISWKLKTQHNQPIGLDIGHNSIKMIQLAVDAGKITVIAADKVRVDPSINGDAQVRRDFAISAIQKMLAEGNFRGKEVVSLLSNDKLKITSLRLTEAENAKIEQTLRKEVSQRFGLNSDDDIIRYLHAGSVHQGEEVKNELILFAADNDTIKEHIEMLEQAGLRPVGIETVPCALFRSFERLRRRQEDTNRTVVFIDIGSRFTTVVFGCGGEISFVKQIPIGGEKFNSEISAKLGVDIKETVVLRESLLVERANLKVLGEDKQAVDSSSEESEETSSKEDVSEKEPDRIQLDASTRQILVDSLTSVAEELAKEISRCFRYYTVTFRGKRVEQAVFAGGEAYEGILMGVLKRQLTADIEVAEPLKGLDISGERSGINFDSDRRGLLCEWAVAVGLGLKGWDNGQKKAN